MNGRTNAATSMGGSVVNGILKEYQAKATIEPMTFVTVGESEYNYTERISLTGIILMQHLLPRQSYLLPIDDNTVFAAYIEKNYSRPCCGILKKSGGKWTNGTFLQVISSGYGSGDALGLYKISATSVLLIQGSRFYKISISGTTCTVASSTEISQLGNISGGVEIWNSKTRGLVLFGMAKTSGTSGTLLGYLCNLSVSGTPSVSNVTAISCKSCNMSNYAKAIVRNGDRLAITYGCSGSKNSQNHSYGVTFDISNGFPSSVTPLDIASGVSSGYNDHKSACFIDEQTVMFVVANDKLNIYSCSGNSLIQVSTKTLSDKVNCLMRYDDNTILLLRGDSGGNITGVRYNIAEETYSDPAQIATYVSSGAIPTVVGLCEVSSGKYIMMIDDLGSDYFTVLMPIDELLLGEYISPSVDRIDGLTKTEASAAKKGSVWIIQEANMGKNIVGGGYHLTDYYPEMGVAA